MWHLHVCKFLVNNNPERWLHIFGPKIRGPGYTLQYVRGVLCTLFVTLIFVTHDFKCTYTWYNFQIASHYLNMSDVITYRFVMTSQHKIILVALMYTQVVICTIHILNSWEKSGWRNDLSAIVYWKEIYLLRKILCFWKAFILLQVIKIHSMALQLLITKPLGFMLYRYWIDL